MAISSHMDGVGSALWATYSSAVLPLIEVTISINVHLIRIIINLLLRAIVGWIISTIILTIAKIPKVIVLLSMLLVNMFINTISNWISDEASTWREINKYTPNTKYLVPIGVRVGFYGERIMFGGNSSSPKNKRTAVGVSVLGYHALRVFAQ